MSDKTERKKLEQWLRRQLYARDNCSKFAMRHISSEGKAGNEVWSIDVPKKGLSEEKMETLLGEINQCAYDDACGIGGLQRYVVQSFHSGSEKPSQRYVFRVEGESPEDDGMDSEPATQKGLIAQQMRHNEALARTITMMVTQLGPSFNRTIGQLTEHNEKLMDKHMENIVATEELLSLKHTRDLEMKQLESKDKRANDVWEKAQILVPFVANRLLGKKVLPESIEPQMAMLKALLSSFSQEQVQNLMMGMSVEQRMAFLEFYETFRAEHEEKMKSNGNTTKEAPDAA